VVKDYGMKIQEKAELDEKRKGLFMIRTGHYFINYIN